MYAAVIASFKASLLELRSVPDHTLRQDQDIVDGVTALYNSISRPGTTQTEPVLVAAQSDGPNTQASHFGRTFPNKRAYTKRKNKTRKSSSPLCVVLPQDLSVAHAEGSVQLQATRQQQEVALDEIRYVEDQRQLTDDKLRKDIWQLFYYIQHNLLLHLITLEDGNARIARYAYVAMYCHYERWTADSNNSKSEFYKMYPEEMWSRIEWALRCGKACQYLENQIPGLASLVRAKFLQEKTVVLHVFADLARKSMKIMSLVNNTCHGWEFFRQNLDEFNQRETTSSTPMSSVDSIASTHRTHESPPVNDRSVNIGQSTRNSDGASILDSGQCSTNINEYISRLHASPHVGSDEYTVNINDYTRNQPEASMFDSSQRFTNINEYISRLHASPQVGSDEYTVNINDYTRDPHEASMFDSSQYFTNIDAYTNRLHESPQVDSDANSNEYIVNINEYTHQVHESSLSYDRAPTSVHPVNPDEQIGLESTPLVLGSHQGSGDQYIDFIRSS